MLDLVRKAAPPVAVVLVLLAGTAGVFAQKDPFEGRNMDRVHTDSSGSPYVIVTYDLDLKSNVTKNGVTNAFVVTTVTSRSIAPVLIAHEYEIKCEERLIRFSTAADIKLIDGKLTLAKTREINESFVDPYTDRSLKSDKRGALKAIVERSCAKEL